MLQPSLLQWLQAEPKCALATELSMSSHPSQQAVQGWQFLVLIAGMRQR
jgi:hypothetical protein